MAGVLGPALSGGVLGLWRQAGDGDGTSAATHPSTHSRRAYNRSICAMPSPMAVKQSVEHDCGLKSRESDGCANR